MEAVGVPVPTLTKPNLAELVAVEPRSRSSLVFLSTMALLLFSVNGEPPLRTGRIPVTREAFPKFRADDERSPVASDWTTPRPRLLIRTLPLFKTVNLLAPETEAVKMS